ncbi:DUF4893 domain-containing protein [Sphingomonas lutea]|uniref:DUF4893 domain-containing protein n=1 Tax=Sphingomonas lutea TaxID=1045317 RepID=A0A7G9SH24_9SPHN|nr:DUF4893 domain-containing protein [Sphingomonas lutea]QNN67149.1 DUF4893 domain-containing protein [Sphingomonas lutea]
MRWKFALAFASLAASGCASMQPPPATAAPPRTNWRVIATDDDRARLRDWRATFIAALDAARRAGHEAEIRREGALLQPDAALPGAIPNGVYRCRVIKIGAKQPGLLDYISYPAFRCRISPSGMAQSFIKETGSQRQVGLIYPVDQVRQVFLGTLVLGDERGALRYGQDRTRDVAGFIERIGPNRWRMIMPRPHFESQLDVLELVPAS